MAGGAPARLALALGLLVAAGCPRREAAGPPAGASRASGLPASPSPARPASARPARPREATSTPAAEDLSLRGQVLVSALQQLLHNQEIPAHFTWDGQEEHYAEPVRRGDEFDVNRVFGVLDRLAPEEGYTLDYVCNLSPYLGDGLPFLYARRAAAPRFGTFSAFQAAQGGGELPWLPAGSGPVFYEEEGRLAGWARRVRADGSAESFLQLAILRTMGRQFYRYNHGLLDDWTPICGPAAALAESGLDLAAVAGLDLAPRVRFGPERVEVRVVVFSRFQEGFYEDRYVFARQFPHRVLDRARRRLVYVKYDGPMI